MKLLKTIRIFESLVFLMGGIILTVGFERSASWVIIGLMIVLTTIIDKKEKTIHETKFLQGIVTGLTLTITEVVPNNFKDNSARAIFVNPYVHCISFNNTY